MVVINYVNQEDVALKKYIYRISEELGPSFELPISKKRALKFQYLNIQLNQFSSSGISHHQHTDAQAIAHQLARYWSDQGNSFFLFSLRQTYNDDLDDKMGLSLVYERLIEKRPIPLLEAKDLCINKDYFDYLEQYLPDNLMIIIYDEFPSTHQMQIETFYNELKTTKPTIQFIHISPIVDSTIPQNRFIMFHKNQKDVENDGKMVLSILATLNQSYLNRELVRAVFQHIQRDFAHAEAFLNDNNFFHADENRPNDVKVTGEDILLFSRNNFIGAQDMLVPILDTLTELFSGKDCSTKEELIKLHKTYNNAVLDVLRVFKSPEQYNSLFNKRLDEDLNAQKALYKFLNIWIFEGLLNCLDFAYFIKIGSLVTDVLKSYLIGNITLSENICHDDNPEMQKLRKIAQENSDIIQTLYYAMRLAGIGYYEMNQYETARGYFIKSLAIAYANNFDGKNYNHISGAYQNIARSYADTPQAYLGVQYNEKSRKKLEQYLKDKSTKDIKDQRREINLHMNIAYVYQEDCWYAAYKIQRENKDLAPIFDYRHKIVSVLNQDAPKSIADMKKAFSKYIQLIRQASSQPDLLTNVEVALNKPFNEFPPYYEDLATEINKQPIDNNRLDEMLASITILHNADETLIKPFIQTDAFTHMVETVELLGMALVKYERYINRATTPEGDLFEFAHYFESAENNDLATLNKFYDFAKSGFETFRNSALSIYTQNTTEFDFEHDQLQISVGNVAVIEGDYKKAFTIYNGLSEKYKDKGNYNERKMFLNAQFSLSYLYITEAEDGNVSKYQPAYDIYINYFQEIEGIKEISIGIDDLFKLRRYFERTGDIEKFDRCTDLINWAFDQMDNKMQENEDVSQRDE